MHFVRTLFLFPYLSYPDQKVSVQAAGAASTSPPINIFFYNVEVVNNETKIILEWILGSEQKSQVLEVRSVTRMVNELKTALPQPPGVTFKVLKYSDRSPLLINNQEEMEVLSSVSREEFTVLDIQAAKGNKVIVTVTRYISI